MSKTSTFPLAVVFHSDWGVSTGTGIAGGIDSVIEKDLTGKPVVRGTVLTGVIREQAGIAAQALDDGKDYGPWTRFAGDLFGPGADDDGETGHDISPGQDRPGRGQRQAEAALRNRGMPGRDK